MKIKKLIFILIIILILILLIIFISKIMTKKIINGNNISSQQVVKKILNINSYKAKITVQVQSNKNENNYVLKQEYNTENGFMQEVLEPENIAGVKIIRKDNNLLIENSKLNLNKLLENYRGIENNCLDLINFINEYKSNNNSNYEKKDNKIIMQTKTENSNKYQKNKILYINKEKLIPETLVIQDDNQNMKIIIQYNEIELN